MGDQIKHDLIEDQLLNDLEKMELRIATAQKHVEELEALRFDIKIKLNNTYNSIINRYKNKVNACNKISRTRRKSSVTDKWTACDLYSINQQTLHDLRKNGYDIPEWLKELQADFIDCLSG